MAHLPRAVLRRSRVPALKARLDALVQSTSTEVRDPIHLVRRYSSPADIEVAAVFAATLAFGRVGAFLPVVTRILDQADACGGPATWVARINDGASPALADLQYRWIRGSDLALLAHAIGRLRAQHGSLAEIFVSAHDSDHRTLGPSLEHFICVLRKAAMEIGEVETYDQLSRGIRHCLPQPSQGSGCKRWNMFLRWMVRRPTHPGDPDLGLWDLPPEKLLIPVDTHVLRVARLIGLTHRTDGSWRTAVEITGNLSRIDSSDPVRYDFALAHLGISGGCKAKWVPEICQPCPLRTVCRFGHSRGRVSRASGGAD